HRRVAPGHPHVARVPLRRRGRVLLRGDPSATGGGRLPRGAARGHPGLRGGASARCVPERPRPSTAPVHGPSRMIVPSQYKWFFETTTPVEGHMHAIAGTVVSRQTKFQFMEILETHSYGKCLVLDGRIQSSQADEFIYHELLVQPGLLAHPRPQR